jgi:hypothetical protein
VRTKTYICKMQDEIQKSDKELWKCSELNGYQSSHSIWVSIGQKEESLLMTQDSHWGTQRGHTDCDVYCKPQSHH